jgi:hypothetical protein
MSLGLINKEPPRIRVVPTTTHLAAKPLASVPTPASVPEAKGVAPHHVAAGDGKGKKSRVLRVRVTDPTAIMLLSRAGVLKKPVASAS